MKKIIPFFMSILMVCSLSACGNNSSESEQTARHTAYLEELYVPHLVVGAINKNPAQGVVLLDGKK